MGSKHKRRFQVREVAKLLGTPARRIEGWVEQGLLKPAVRGKGPGRRREFSLENLIQTAVLIELRRTFGEKSPVWTQAIRRGIRETATNILTGKDPTMVDCIFVVLQEKGEVAATFFANPQPLEVLIKEISKGRAMTIVNIGDVISKIQALLKEWEG